MDNTLWIFGDSFSWDHKIRFKTYPHLLESDDCIVRYLRYRDGKDFDTWGDILAKKLNMKYENHASYQTGVVLPHLSGGPSNNNNVNLIHEFSNLFKKGDIVIFGFTDICRFEWGNNQWVQTYLPNDSDESEKEIINKILVNRYEHPYYKYDILQKMKAIETLSNIVGFQLWYWDWTGQFDELVTNELIPSDRWIFFKSFVEYQNYEYMMVYQMNGGNIAWETNNLIPDGHMGEVGNDIHANIFFNFLKYNKKTTSVNLNKKNV